MSREAMERALALLRQGHHCKAMDVLEKAIFESPSQSSSCFPGGFPDGPSGLELDVPDESDEQRVPEVTVADDVSYIEIEDGWDIDRDYLSQMHSKLISAGRDHAKTVRMAESMIKDGVAKGMVWRKR